MSVGHGHHGMGVDAHVLEKLISDKEVLKNYHRPYTINRDYDIPYLGGYSKNGNVIYFDRHLPDSISFELDGRKFVYSPIHFIPYHERFEKAVIDALGWGYTAAHEAANAFERRHVMQAGLPWAQYQKSLEPFIKSDEIESIKKIPSDLDMAPYYAPPVNHKLIAKMERASEGNKSDSKQEKSEVEYGDGHATAHCGPTKKWPNGYCENFISPHSCEHVVGYIEPNKWCRLFKPVDSKDEISETS